MKLADVEKLRDEFRADAFASIQNDFNERSIPR